MRRARQTLFLLLLLCFQTAWGQQDSKVSGFVRDELDRPVQDVNVSILGRSKGTLTDGNGFYSLFLPSDTTLSLRFSHASFNPIIKEISLEPGERKDLEVTFQERSIKEVVIREGRPRKTTMMKIPPKTAQTVPTPSGDFINQTLSAQPGVAINNELSSSYSVRGGNFDENLIYVNDIQVYRPFLVRSGRQEGLSFINSDMVSSVLFSAGGFEAKYGDKMSSALDIQYKKPAEFSGSVSGSLLGGSVHLEGASDNYRFTHISGLRYRTNQYVLNSLQTQGQYRPNFTDFQTYMTYDITEKFELGFLGNYSRNIYNFVPQSRKTEYGTLNQPLRLSVQFEGSERDQFETYMGALSGTYRHNQDLELKLIASAFRSDERETFDIRGYYRLDELQKNLGSDDFGDVVRNRGIGAFHDHARNELQAYVYNFAHKGDYEFGDDHLLEWGVKYQREQIVDQLKEWKMLDSAGFNVPHPKDSVGYTNPGLQPDHELELSRSVRSHTNLSSNRYSGYLQNTWNWDLKDTSELSVTAGARAQYWDLNHQFLASPRANIAWKPYWFSQKEDTTLKRDFVFRFSTGYYYQPPFYKELRDLDGNIHKDVKAQQAIHFVLGSDYVFKAWGRPFKFTTDLYYKQLNNLNPYEVDNVRIRYYANNNAKGYATGIDLKLNGEFVKGIESWASISLMQTKEDIQGDHYYIRYNDDGEEVIPGYTADQQVVDSVKREPGHIPRPMEQLVNFGLFFQDEMPRWPSYKVHLNLLYASGLPFGPPTFKRYEDTLTAPPYRRVDIGFSKDLIHPSTDLSEKPFFKNFDRMTISLEVFNLLAINNTISYLWIEDVANRQYAIPNYLTGRRFNLKLEIGF